MFIMQLMYNFLFLVCMAMFAVSSSNITVTQQQQQWVTTHFCVALMDFSCVRHERDSAEAGPDYTRFFFRVEFW